MVTKAGVELAVGTGQAGTQIAEDLVPSGREVHLAVSVCPGAPRRYRGRDTFDWLVPPMAGRSGGGCPVPDRRHAAEPGGAVRWQPDTADVVERVAGRVTS